jgi:hypothetical protein
MKLLTTTTVTQYYATGNLGIARAIFDRLWSGSGDGKERIWAKLVLQMRCSQYGIEGIRCSD